MARRNYSKSKPRHTKVANGNEIDRLCFLADLVDGTISATTYIESRNPRGRITQISYDEP
jgi:hypothetical protein